MAEEDDIFKTYLAEYNDMTPEERLRFECFRRSALPKDPIKKIIQAVTEYQIHDKLAIAIAGVSKMFLGEIIERDNHFKADMEGPLTVNELREAFRQLMREERFPQFESGSPNSPFTTRFKNLENL